MLWLGLGRDRLRAGRGLGHKEPGAVHVGDGAEARAAVAATGLEGTEDDRGRGAGARLRGAAEVWECGARGWRRLAWIQPSTRRERIVQLVMLRYRTTGMLSSRRVARVTAKYSLERRPIFCHACHAHHTESAVADLLGGTRYARAWMRTKR